MKTFSITISLLFITTLGIFAQNMGGDKQLEESYISSKTTPINKGYKNTEGSIYMDKEFQLGSVITNGKVVANNVGLRYNVQNDEIEFLKNPNTTGTVANLLKKDNKIHAKIGNDILVFLPSSSDTMRDGYFVIIKEGERISLYKKIIKDFRPGKVSVNSIARSVPNTFKEKEALYVKTQDGMITEVPNSKSKRRKIFIGKEDEMKKYINKNKLNIRKDDDLVLAINHYNSLM